MQFRLSLHLRKGAFSLSRSRWHYPCALLSPSGFPSQSEKVRTSPFIYTTSAPIVLRLSSIVKFCFAKPAYVVCRDSIDVKCVQCSSLICTRPLKDCYMFPYSSDYIFIYFCRASHFHSLECTPLRDSRYTFRCHGLARYCLRLYPFRCSPFSRGFR